MASFVKCDGCGLFEDRAPRAGAGTIRYTLISIVDASERDGAAENAAGYASYDLCPKCRGELRERSNPRKWRTSAAP